MSVERQKDRDGERDGYFAYTLTSPVQLHTLAAEIGEGRNGRLPSFIAEGDPLSASSDAPAVLWAETGLVPSRLSKAVEAHKVPTPDLSLKDDLAALLVKLDGGKDLTKDETRLVLRTLLSRVVR